MKIIISQKKKNSLRGLVITNFFIVSQLLCCKPTELLVIYMSIEVLYNIL